VRATRLQVRARSSGMRRGADGALRRVLAAARLAVAIVGRAAGWALIALVRAYQVLISPLMPPCCRFQPTCSQYMIEAIRKRGPLIGVLKGLWRLARCNPLCRGGYDPVDGPGEPENPRPP